MLECLAATHHDAAPQQGELLVMSSVRGLLFAATVANRMVITDYQANYQPLAMYFIIGNIVYSSYSWVNYSLHVP